MIDFKQLLQELHDTKLIRVTGSYADGSNQDGWSDIDFHVKEDRPDTPRDKRNIRKIINILEQHGLVWGSPFIGCVGVGYDGNETPLPIAIEFSDLFKHRPGRLPEVTIEGITFKTW